MSHLVKYLSHVGHLSTLWSSSGRGRK